MDDVPRPTATPSLSDRAREWLNWFGVTRLVTSAVATIIVCAGGWWLVSTPQPPTEAALPVATASSAPSPTLPPPDAAATPSASADSAAVIVHVAGAVADPGVYELPGSSRVERAIEAAGGALPAAELDALNLAAPVSDGSRIYVPEPGEVVPIAPDPASDADLAPAGPIDVNRATAAELETLPGVGPATAAAIVNERDRNGPFVSIDDIERVPGIGPAKLAGFADLVTT